MKLKINILLILLIILFCITKQIDMYLILMLFILLHELAHIVVGKILKLKIDYIEIIPFGVSVKFVNNFYLYYLEEYEDEKITNSLKNLLVAIAGPVLNVIIAVIIGVFDINIYNFTAENLVYINILIASFNLLPIYPLDGGRILEAILNIYTHPIRTKEIVYKITKCTMVCLTLVASILVYYYQNIWIFFGVLYMWFGVVKNQK